MIDKKKRFKILIGILLLSGAIMIGHGARMMYQGIFKPNSIYPAPTPNTIDFYFDWMTLLILGIMIFSYATFMFYKSQKNKDTYDNKNLEIIGFQAT